MRRNCWPRSGTAVSIRTLRVSGLRVRRLERGELSTFVKLCDMSAARQGFKSRDLAYYERLFDTSAT